MHAIDSVSAETLLAGVRSFCPGRLRLRLALLRGADESMVGMIRGLLSSRPGVTGIEINPRVGSLLLTWDAAKTDLDLASLAEEAAGLFSMAQSMGMFEAEDSSGARRAGTACAAKAGLEAAAGRLEALAAPPLEALAKVIAPDVRKGARAKRVAQNRLMLALLAASIAVLAGGGARAHTGFGAAFMGLLGVHLWQHRRVL